MNYGTLENGIMKPAPSAIRIGGAVVCNPTDAQYEAAGYKRVVDTPPQTGAAHYAVPVGWAEQGGEIVRQYEVREYPPPPPRRWSRLSIKGALADAHMLPSAKAFLSAFEVKPDYTAWEALTDCNYIEEGYGGQEKWNAILDGAAQAFGKTRAEIDAFLDAIPQEGGA